MGDTRTETSTWRESYGSVVDADDTLICVCARASDACKIAALPDLLEVLKQQIWIVPHFRCPRCDCFRGTIDPHRPDCPIGIAIRKAEGR